MLSLCITGFDAHPDRVTTLLELKPTSIGVKGEASQSGRARTSNGWWLELDSGPLSHGGDHASAVDRCLTLLVGRSDRFRQLREELNPEMMTIYGGYQVPVGEQSGIWLTAAQMGALAGYGLEWSLEIHAGKD